MYIPEFEDTLKLAREIEEQTQGIDVRNDHLGGRVYNPITDGIAEFNQVMARDYHLPEKY